MIARNAGLAALAGALTLCLVAPLKAQEAFPEREVRILVNYGAGGSIDRMARIMQRFLPDALGQSVIVENVAGADGKMGLEKFLEGEADCYTVLAAFAPATTVIKHDNPDLFSMDDLAIINTQWIDPAILLARKDTGWENLNDMIEAVRAEPGKYTLGSSGRGSVGPVLAEQLFTALDLDVKTVPYRGGGAARKAFSGGETHMTAAGAEGALAMRDEAVPLAVFWDGEVAGWPDAPSANEQLKDQGITVPTGGAYRFFAVESACEEQHPERFAKLVDAFEQVTQSEQFKAAAAEAGVGADWLGPQESQAQVEEADQAFEQMLSN